MVTSREAEQEVLRNIKAVYDGILDLGLSVNHGEFTQAIHTLQMIVMMHRLHRLEPDEWNNWFE